MRLRDRRIVVTGGASGIAAATVRAYAAEGARVASLDVDDEAGRRVAAGAGERVTYFHCDISRRGEVEDVVGRAVADMGGLDVLANVAGTERATPAEEITDAEWDLVFDVNLKGTLYTNQAAFRHMKERGGRIINFGSGAGIRGQRGSAHYSAAKGAVMAWTRTVAQEWACHAITVNSIVPAIWTPMYDAFRARMSEQERTIHDLAMQHVIPLGGRLGDPDRDIAPVMVFLAGDDARFITGQAIAVDGGMIMLGVTMEIRLPLPALEPESERFWRACHEGRLEITRCRACGWYVHPPRPVCPRCRSRDLGWEPVSGRATVVSFTVNHQRWMPNLEVPYTIGLVELVEQADLRLTTNIVGCAPEAVQIGMAVRVIFRPVSDEVALPLFEPDPDPPAPPPRPARRPVAPAIRPSADQRLERRAVLSGVGQSQIGRRLFRTDLDLTCEAALAAIADAGLTVADIDGLACYPGPMGTAAPGFAGPPTPDVQDALGLQLGWHGSGGEGPAQLAPVMLAALAVAAGLCRHALVYRTVSEATAAASTGRLGIGAGARAVSGFAQWVIPFGAMSAANWLAFHAVRHMHEFGTRREHLGEIALTARAHAALDPAAIYRDPLTLDDYLAARMITWPFGLYDCDVPVDGSTAVVVSAADAARDLRTSAVRIHAVGSSIRSRPVWDQWEDLTTMAARDAAEQMWARADVRPADVDTIQLYDGFSWLTLAWIEALGFCKRGEAGPFVEGGRVRLGGELPLNTWGGQLSGGRLHGFGFLAEAIRQLRGECGPRQVPDCEVAVVAAGGGPIAGCLLLTR